MKDKDMWGRTRYQHGRKRGYEFTCGQTAKILVLAAILGLAVTIVLKEIL